MGSVGRDHRWLDILLVATGLVLGIWRKLAALYFGPIWMLIALIPTIAAGYESPRHLYLGAVAWAMLLGFAFQLVWAREASPRLRIAATVVAAAVVVAYLVPLRAALDNYTAPPRSRKLRPPISSGRLRLPRPALSSSWARHCEVGNGPCPWWRVRRLRRKI